MSADEKVNQYLYKSSSFMRKGLAEVQAKVNDLYKIEELADYAEIKDNPVEHVFAALMPLVVQVNDFQDYAETVTGKMELDLQDDVDIYAVLDGVLTIADQLIEQKDGVTSLVESDPQRCQIYRERPYYSSYCKRTKGYFVRSARYRDWNCRSRSRAGLRAF